MKRVPRRRILAGDVLDRLADLPAGSIDCCITSPPYYMLRDYGVSGQLGLENTVNDWVATMRTVVDGIGRVLKPSGSIWLNLGDGYSRRKQTGSLPKSLYLSPERLLIALADAGWYVRNKVIWAKTSPMPTSIADRLATTYDVVYLLTKQPTYYFNIDEIRVPLDGAATREGAVRLVGKNPGDVWRLPGARFRGAHFATFPPELVKRPLLATCPEKICALCGEPWRRDVVVTRTLAGKNTPTVKQWQVMRFSQRYTVRRLLGPLAPGCLCNGAVAPGVVLDPFFGAGTVGVVAEEHGRDWVGIEINPKYRRIARERLKSERAKRAKKLRIAT